MQTRVERDAEGNKKRYRRELKGMRKAIRGAANCNMKGMITAIRYTFKIEVQFLGVENRHPSL